jgi:hypothetical protein
MAEVAAVSKLASCRALSATVASTGSGQGVGSISHAYEQEVWMLELSHPGPN